MSLQNAFRDWKRRRRVKAARAELATRHVSPRPHRLAHPLTVSLTSYPARYGTLALTLRSLLRQTVRADRTVLWIAAEDHAALPPDVLDLQGEGLTIGLTDDLRSYSKLIPALQAHPGNAIVTADDDLCYWPDWLEQLVTAHQASGAGVVCHRGHGIVLDALGLPRPYADWTRLEQRQQSALVFPTGVMGVLYAPDVFHPDVTDRAKFQRLCPGTDDVWFYWMHRLRGQRALQLGGRRKIVEWPGTQTQNLRAQNLAGQGNDRNIAAMIAAYGFPDPL